MSIVFYSAQFSSASPVASALIELELEHELVQFDLTRDDHKQPEYLKLNPNGKVPTLVVDGTPMFEALAILIWLGERYGVERELWPAAQEPARMQALAWCTWAYVTYGATLGRMLWSSSERIDTSLHHPPQAKQASEQLQDLLAILDARLIGQPYLLGDSYTLVDLTVASVIGYGELCGVSVESHPHVLEWLHSFRARRSYFEVMQGPR